MTFDQFVSDNYYTLRTRAKQICQNYDYYEDVLNNVIIKCRQRILTSATTVQNYTAFIITSINNNFLDIKRDEKRKTFIPRLDENLLVDDPNQITQEEQFTVVDSNTNYTFEYLNKYYDQKKVILFKTYYLTDNKTYDKLVKSTGYSFRYVKDSIGTIKKDLKLNLKEYFKYKKLPEYFKPVHHYPMYEVSNKGTVRNIISDEIINPELDIIFHNEIYRLERNGEIIYKSLEQLQKPLFNQVHLFERRTSL